MLLSKSSLHSSYFDTKFPTLSANNGIHIFGIQRRDLFATVDRERQGRQKELKSKPATVPGEGSFTRYKEMQTCY